MMIIFAKSCKTLTCYPCCTYLLVLSFLLPGVVLSFTSSGVVVAPKDVLVVVKQMTTTTTSRQQTIQFSTHDDTTTIMYQMGLGSTTRRRGNNLGQQHRSSFVLYATNGKKSKGVPKSTTTSKSGSGMGFGSTVATPKIPSSSDEEGSTIINDGTSSIANNNNNHNHHKKLIQPEQLRSISGTQMGAGNKVLRTAANNFDRIRKLYGLSSCYDIYVRSPLNSPTTYWFVGKVAIEQIMNNTNNNDSNNESGGVKTATTPPPYQPTIQDACLSQKRIILEYSKLHLRPQNLGGSTYGNTLEIWYAPGDSEMDVVQNKIILQPILGSAQTIHTEFSSNTVGYNPEIYIGDEIQKGGLRVQRNENGTPIKPIFDVYEGEK